MRVFSCILAISLVFPTTGLFAQQSPPVEPGARVRVTAPALRINGKVVRFTAIVGDELVVRTDSVHHYPLGSITQLEVHTGSKSQWRRGAQKGGLMGGLSALIVAATFCGSMNGVGLGEGGGGCEAWGSVALVSLMGAAGGVIIGTGVGLLIQGGGEWQQIDLDQLSVGLVPPRDRRVSFGLSVSF